MPLFHSGVTIVTFEFIVNKVQNKVNGWEVKILLMTGRVTLAKSDRNFMWGLPRNPGRPRF